MSGKSDKLFLRRLTNMDRAKEKELILKKVRDCAENDAFIAKNVWSNEEFDFYSDTSKVMKELADKYSLTLEELDELWNYYDDYKRLIYRKK